LQRAIKTYRDQNGGKKIESPIFVIAHSMGSHVAEAFLKSYEMIDLKGVIFYNPHADHTFYCLKDVTDTYFHKDKKNGFVLSFNSSHDRVLGFLSTNLQNWKRNIFSFFGVFMRQDKYIRPLGISWDKFSDMNMEKHRVVVLHMKKPHKFKYWCCPNLNHEAYASTVGHGIANEAIKTAVDNPEFEIKQITDLVKQGDKMDEAKKNAKEEYVNTEPEREEKGKVNPVEIKEWLPKKENDAFVNEQTPLT